MTAFGGDESAVVRILTSKGTTAGLGVLVGPNAVATCAHVVNTALALNQQEASRPGLAASIQVDFPLLPGSPLRRARVVAWVPPTLSGPTSGDVAGLVLGEDAPAAAIPARLTTDGLVPGAGLRVFGYPGGPPRSAGAWVDLDLKGKVGSQLIQVESRGHQTVKAQPGYSGSPVWSADGRVVGLLHAAAPAHEPDRDAYLIPAVTVAESWEDQFDDLLIPPNPYRGLEPFTAADSDTFFGRDADTDRLVRRLEAHSVTVVIGAPGAGKSSLVQAGLVPRLLKQRPWAVALFRPGGDPWYSLASSVLRAQRPPGPDLDGSGDSGLFSRELVEREVERLQREGLEPTARYLSSQGTPLLVIVEQLEEAFSSAPTRDGHAGLVTAPDQTLLELLIPAGGPAPDASRVVMTLRADFLPALLAAPGIGLRLLDRLYPVSPMTDDEIREAVEAPADSRGVHFESGLIKRIVGDAAPGSLPLLQFALTRLWVTQRRKTLSFAGYEALGGVAGTLNQFADQQVLQLGSSTARAVDQALLRLVRIPAGEPNLTTRLRAYRCDIPDNQWAALQQLAGARLVVINAAPQHVDAQEADAESACFGSFAELVHESLITSWERLTRLVAENVGFLAWLATIEVLSTAGDLAEARIPEAKQWFTSRANDVPDRIKDFIERSEAAAESRWRQLAEAVQRAEAAQHQAETTAQWADALRLAAEAELALQSRRSSTTVALALATESLMTAPTVQGDVALRHVFSVHARTCARLDHDGPVFAVAFAPDGSRVATASRDGSARVFDAATATEIARLDHDDRVTAVAFGPDGTRVATASSDGSARVFDAATGAQLARLDHEGAALAVAFAPDGSRVATASRDRSARVFDAVTGTELIRLDHDKRVTAVAFGPDCTRVATASDDGSARVFDAATGTQLARLDHEGPVLAVAFAPDGSRVATASRDRSARIFDAATGTQLARLDHGDRVTAVAFGPDGTRVATASGDGSARVFDAATGSQLARLDHDNWVTAVAFGPDGTRVATASDDGSARVFDAATGTQLARLDHDDRVTAVAFAPDGTRVATASRDRSARVFAAAAGSQLARLDHEGAAFAVAFAPDGTRVATASRDRSARVFDAATGTELARLDHDGSVNAIAFAPDGTRVATASDDASARVFDAATGIELARLDHDGSVNAVAFAPDGTRVATASWDRSARVFDALTSAELARLDHDGSVNAVAFGPDGTRVATASRDRSIRVFDVATGAELARLDHDGSALAVAFAPDGTRVATASWDGSARVVDAATGTELTRIVHRFPVVAVAFAPDGSRVATASWDGSARVFDAATGAELARLHHDDRVTAVAFAPEGSRVATASRDRSVRVFDAVTGIQLARLDHDGSVNAVAFTSDGTRVATASRDRSARVFELDSVMLRRRALELMSRPLNRTELRQHGLSSDCLHLAAWARLANAAAPPPHNFLAREHSSD